MLIPASSGEIPAPFARVRLRTRGPRSGERVFESLLQFAQARLHATRQVQPKSRLVATHQRFQVSQRLCHLELSEGVLRAGDGLILDRRSGDHQKYSYGRPALVQLTN